MLLFTGGAVVMGALDWLAGTGEPVTNLDALTRAGNVECLATFADAP